MRVDHWLAAGRHVSVLGRTLFVVDSGAAAGPPSGRVTSWDEPAPVLLMLHGFPTSSWDWWKVWPALTRHFRCIAPDFLGLGFSEKPRPHLYRIGEQADLVEALCDALGIDRCHVLVHDYGCTVAQEVLARENERLSSERRWRSVAFLNGGLFPETHRPRLVQRLLAGRLGPALARLGGLATFRRSFSAVFGPHTRPSPSELEDFWRIIRFHDGNEVFPSLIGYLEERWCHRTRWVGALAESHCPLMVLNGSLDPVSGAHMVDRYRTLVGHGRVVQLPEVGHYPQLEAPDRVVREYRTWIDDIRGGWTTDRWDLLIAGAMVYDGTGGPPFVQDVAVRGGHVVARGSALDRSRAREVVEAHGRWLVPGMVDVHTHFDLELEVEPGLPEALRHGTTTVVMSNCSLGLAFGNQRHLGADPIVDCFARVENVPKKVLRKVADQATWRSSREYLEHLDELPLGPNVVPLVPHSMLRVEVMGLDGAIGRDPTEHELARMEELVHRAMEEGYAGMSTDALPFHYLANAPHQRERVPANHSTYGELARLLSVVRRYDRVWQATPPKDRPLDIVRLFSLSTGVLHGTALKTTAVAALELESNKLLSALGRVLSVVWNRLLGARFRLQALAAPFKTWAEGPITPLAEEIEEMRRLCEPELDDREGRRAILDDPAWQASFLEMWRRGKSGWSLDALKRWLRWEDFAIRRDLSEMVVERAPVQEWAGDSLQAIFERLRAYQAGSEAAARSIDEEAAFEKAPSPIADDAEFLLHLLREYDRELVWWTISANADPEGVARRLEDPLLLPGFSDAGAHLVNMAFFDANLRALKIAWSRDTGGSAENSVARMVHRLTREPARFFGVDAGGMELGDRADLVLIDPDALAAWEPDASVRRIHRDVLGAEQLVNRPPGVVRGVWVRGRLVYDGTALQPELGTRPLGRALRAHGFGLEQATEPAEQIAAPADLARW